MNVVTVVSLIDNTKVSFPQDHARLCEVLQTCLEDCDDDGEPIPIDLTGPVLTKLAEFCAQQYNQTRTATWDKEFMDVAPRMVYDIIVAANKLDLKPLIELAADTVADAIKTLPVDDMKTCVGLKEPSWTPEQKAALFAEQPWLLDVLPSDKAGDKIIEVPTNT